MLHPEMAVIYRAKVTELAKALQEPDCRSEATEALRGLVDAIGDDHRSKCAGLRESPSASRIERWIR